MLHSVFFFKLYVHTYKTCVCNCNDLSFMKSYFKCDLGHKIVSYEKVAAHANTSKDKDAKCWSFVGCHIFLVSMLGLHMVYLH